MLPESLKNLFTEMNLSKISSPNVTFDTSLQKYLFTKFIHLICTFTKFFEQFNAFLARPRDGAKRWTAQRSWATSFKTHRIQRQLRSSCERIWKVNFVYISIHTIINQIFPRNTILACCSMFSNIFIIENKLLHSLTLIIIMVIFWILLQWFREHCSRLFGQYFCYIFIIVNNISTILL